MELVVIGLQNSGKSTLVSQLAAGEPLEQGPTIGCDVQTFKKGSVDMKCWDLGGQRKNLFLRLQYPRFLHSGYST